MQYLMKTSRPQDKLNKNGLYKPRPYQISDIIYIIFNFTANFEFILNNIIQRI